MNYSGEESTDTELLAGDREDFAQLFDKYARTIYRYAARRVGPDIAEDIVADTFMRAFENRHKFNTSATSALPWLYGIATNLLRRQHRNETRALKAFARNYADPLGSGQVATDDTAEASVSRLDASNTTAQLAQALAALPAKQRDVLLLYAWAELSYAEIATALDISIGTVRSRLNRTRAVLRAAHNEFSTAKSFVIAHGGFGG